MANSPSSLPLPPPFHSPPHCAPAHSSSPPSLPSLSPLPLSPPSLLLPSLTPPPLPLSTYSFPSSSSSSSFLLPSSFSFPAGLGAQWQSFDAGGGRILPHTPPGEVEAARFLDDDVVLLSEIEGAGRVFGVTHTHTS
eukprot:749701-Hanusia_phi.AAC.2